jgi:hypothetical protein
MSTLAGMPFFAARPAPDGWEEEDRQAWIDPTDRIVGGLVPTQIWLVETDRVAVVVSGMFADRMGLSLSLTVVRRRPALRVLSEHALRMGEGMDRPGEDGPRFGVGLADGTKLEAEGLGGVANGDYRLFCEGGGGSPTRKTWDFRLEPAPPPGPLLLVCAWPQLDVEESFAEIDGSLISDAAGTARVLWPDEPTPSR